METKELVERLNAPSVLIDGAPGLLEYLPGKKRIGPPDNITAIIQRLEKNCRDAAAALEAAERQIGHKAEEQIESLISELIADAQDDDGHISKLERRAAEALSFLLAQMK